MKRIGMAVIIVFFISGLVAAGAVAQMAGGKGKGPGKGMGEGCGMGMWDGAHAMYVIKALDLDDNQSAEVKSILHRLQKQMIKKRADIEVAEVELKEILEKDPVDVKTAETKVKQIASLKTEVAMLHIQGIEDVKAKADAGAKKETGRNDANERDGTWQGKDGLPHDERSKYGESTGCSGSACKKQIQKTSPARQHTMSC